MRIKETKGTLGACLALALAGAGAAPVAAQTTQPDQPARASPRPDTRTAGPQDVDQDEANERTDESPRGPARARRSDREESRYRFELGVTPRYVSNFFQAQDEFDVDPITTPKRSVYITTLTGGAEYDLVQREQSTLTAGLRVRRNLVNDLPGADSTEIDVTLDYSFRPNQLRLGYFRTPRRLASVSNGQNVYSEVNGFSAEYLRRITKRLRARAGYQFARETFSAFQERDTSRHQFRGDLRYQIDPLFTPGIGLEYLRGDAATENFSYKRPAVSFLVNSRINDVAYLTFRYRLSKREFDTELPTDSNFGREDRRGDLSFYGTAQLGNNFSLFGFASRTKSNSNRNTRDFTNFETGLGLFYRFP